MAASDSGTHPVIALWPVAIASEVEEALERGESRMHAFAARHEAAVVAFPQAVRGERRIDPFFNANTPEDLEQARAFLAS